MELINEVNLLSYSTMGVLAVAKKFGVIREIKDWKYLIETRQIPTLILGGGSNILFVSREIDFVVQNHLLGKKIIKEDKQHLVIEVGSGELWHDFVTWTVEQGYGGLENLSLIPGTVGAAPIQNIGAYGVEQKDCFHSLTYIDLKTGKLHQLSKINCQFSYRSSIFKKVLKGKVAIISVRYQLTKRDHHIKTEYGQLARELQGKVGLAPSPKDIAQAVIKIRQQKLPDPKQLGNAGSFFKNPIVTKQRFDTLIGQYPEMPYFRQEASIKIPAAWLIQSCGWKGYRRGDIGVYPQHALILVNYGTGTGLEIKTLAQKIIQSVEEKFRIKLSPEVTYI